LLSNDFTDYNKHYESIVKRAFTLKLRGFMPKKLHQYDAYLFDLDGTLIDTTPDIAAAINHVRGVHHLPQLNDEEVAQGVGHGATYLLNRCFPNVNPQNFTIIREQFLNYYQTHLCIFTQPYPDVIHCLNQLRLQGKKIALVTNKPMHLTQPLLEKLEWLPFFDFICGGDSFVHRKPHPLPILNALAALQTEPQNALFIGDTEVDAQAAQAAYVHMVAVPYGRVSAQVQSGDWGNEIQISALTSLCL
jgi:2-phosphoglycolate phosphatase